MEEPPESTLVRDDARLLHLGPSLPPEILLEPLHLIQQQIPVGDRPSRFHTVVLVLVRRISIWKTQWERISYVIQIVDEVSVDGILPQECTAQHLT